MLADPERTLADLINAASPLNGAAAEPVVASQAWPQIAEAAQRSGVAPLLYASLKAAGRPHQPPEPILERLRGLYMQASAANWWAYQELAQWLERFAQEQIPVVLLKGCALAATLYAGVGLRPVGDLDLLIPRADVKRARALLLAQSYKPFTTERGRDCELRFAYQATYWREGEHPSQLDLHWHLFNIPYYADRIPIEWFWQRTVPITLNGHAAQALSPTAQLLHLSMHFALHRWERLVHAYDIALLLTREFEQINWDEVLEASKAFHLVRALQVALARVQACWGAAIPPDVAMRLHLMRPTRSERWALAASAAKRTDALNVLQGLTTPGLKSKLQFWLCYTFPSAAYMCDRYHLSPRMAPLGYVWRIIAGMFQVVRSVLAMLLPRNVPQ